MKSCISLCNPNLNSQLQMYKMNINHTISTLLIPGSEYTTSLLNVIKFISGWKLEMVEINRVYMHAKTSLLTKGMHSNRTKSSKQKLQP